MKNPLHLSAIIAVAFGLGALSLLAAGEDLSLKWFASISTASFGTGLAILAFDKVLWRIPYLQEWFVTRPHLAGQWKIELISMWNDPQTGLSPAPIAGTATITQTHSEFHMHVETDESEGDLIEGSIVRKKDGAYQVVGVYLNQPKVSVRDRSAMHHGAMMLDVVGDPNSPSKLKGSYWTERRSVGEFRATQIYRGVKGKRRKAARILVMSVG
ncbi:MAG: hypothetical protein SGJ21_04005 [Alphaproteobacteria bacterium]|nr:hypothetical protein [Alphaproteobacteria bacterium]